MRDVFREIYRENFWKNDESVSGNGSTIEATSAVRSALPGLVKRLSIQTILDVPCGDYNWWPKMKLPGVLYTGADIVPELVETNRKKYQDDTHQFVTLDITRDSFPPYDLVFVRDLFGHFSNADIKRALANIRQSDSRYLLATTFPTHEDTGDIVTGQWRPVNLDQLWGLPAALDFINERCRAGSGQFADKSLGLWRLQ